MKVARQLRQLAAFVLTGAEKNYGPKPVEHPFFSYRFVSSYCMPRRWVCSSGHSFVLGGPQVWSLRNEMTHLATVCDSHVINSLRGQVSVRTPPPPRARAGFSRPSGVVDESLTCLSRFL